LTWDDLFITFASEIHGFMATPHTFKKTYHNFYEKQRLKSVWLYSVLVIATILCVTMSIIQISAAEPINLNSFLSSEFFLITALLIVPVYILLFLFRFETVMNKDGIFYRLKPFHKKFNMLQWEDVKEMKLVVIPPFSRVLGKSKKYKESFYMGGGVGLEIHMRSGSVRMFGTRKAEEMNHKMVYIAQGRYTQSDIGQDKNYSD
jgi:hypothetical protein